MLPQASLGNALTARTMLGFCAGLALASNAVLAQVAPSDLGIELEQVATGLVAPILVTHAGDGSNRLFVLDQIGKVRIIQNGVLLPTPFLDVGPLMPVINPGYDERGLLGIAFHPNYAVNGRFFLRYSVPRTGVSGEPCFGTSRGCHAEVLAEFHRSASDPNIADPTPTILISVDKPQFNHNSGDVVFGPDGLLYFTLGDGGGANDGLADVPPSHGPTGNAQNLGVLLGKVHRIDVDSISPPLPYGIPPSNPFVATIGARPEIFAYGLRNPYRFSFDSGPGGDNRMWLSDVGQGLTEEVNIGQAGTNYGWPIREGDRCFDPFNNTTYPPDSFCAAQSADLTPPVAVYQHVESSLPIGIAVVGGIVYRGSQFSSLVGKYVFGDFSTSFGLADGHLFYLDSNSPAQVRRFRLGKTNRQLNQYLKGMGRDEHGEIYICTGQALGPLGTSGSVYHIVPSPCPADLDDGTGTATPDGGVDINDLLFFLSAFEAGSASADLDNGSNSGTTDGGVDINDLLYFLAHFEAGC